MRGLGTKWVAMAGLLLARPSAAQVHRDVVIDAPEAVAALQQAGLDLGTVAFGHKAVSNDALQQTVGWPSVVRLIADALQDRTKVGNHRAGRSMFDLRWLTARQANFQLIAVVNRIDRAPFAASGCGETRLLYRLGYDRGDDASRLPMTLNVIFRQPGTCFEAWKRWPWQANLQPDLLTHPDAALAPEMLGVEHLLAIELNLQRVIWPAAAKPELGGRAEFALRVLRRRDDGTFAAAPMENQPDVARLQRDVTLRTRLLAWLREPANLAAIDAGTAVLPEEFLATTATSASPLGLARRQNRPFRQVFSPEDFADANLRPFAQMATPTLLLRRLDTLSCTGCHQSNSLTGFHLLGEEARSQRLDALAVGRSAHLTREIAARQADMDRWPEVPPPRRLDAADLLDAGMPNGPCGLHDSGIPPCADLPTARLRCVQVDDEEAGVCIPESGEIGGVCEAGAVQSVARTDRDSLTHRTTLACPGGSLCQSSRDGFPGGHCAGPCGNPPDGTTCVGMPDARRLSRCLARRQPFATCVNRSAVDVLVRACSADSPCRADFVCRRGPQGQGACVPGHLLRQLRVDGHPPVR